MRLPLLRKQGRELRASTTRAIYDGPAGAVLALASLVSLHEPLMGRMFRRRALDVSTVGAVLDIGSGAGQILGHLVKSAPQRAKIVGVDLSHQMLLRARKRLKDPRPLLMAADMTQLPFADEQFDCVTCGFVLEYLPDPRTGLREFRRMLRPGGRLLLLATEDTPPGLLTGLTWRCRTFDRKELHAACEESGLPWRSQLWFSPVHRFFKLGGILVEAVKPGGPSNGHAT